MKDSYSFDRDDEGLDASYELHRRAYERILDRCELRWYEVESDVGMMGGSDAHEYMAPCAAGENEVALAPGYAANVEVASAEAQPVELPPALDEPREAPTPGLTTVDEVSGALGVAPGAALKAMPVIVEGRGMVLALVRGDHRLNEIKLRNALGAGFRQASPEEIEAELGPPGFIGPVGAEVPVIKDAAIQGSGYFAGANKPDAHLIGVEPGRDFEFTELDVRTVEAGDLSPSGDPIEIETAIEVGNIFKLGTRYSEPLGATYLDPDGREQPIVMGCYGIGPARIIAAAIEQGADEQGIVWPRSLAPWQVHLVALGKHGEETFEAAERLYEELGELGIEMSCSTTARPVRARSSPTPSCSAARCGSWSASGRSPTARSRRASGARAPTTGSRSPMRRDAPARSSSGSAELMPSKRRLFGIDRSGPLPSQTRRGAPLHPWTLPNLVGYLRLASHPGLPRPRLQHRRRARHRSGAALPVDRGGRLPRRLPRPGDRPVLAHGRAARSGRRSARGPRRRRGLLALRAAAALGARAPGRTRGRDPAPGRSSRCGAGSTSRSTGSAGSASSWSSAGSSGAWSSTGGSSRRASSSAC